MERIQDYCNGMPEVFDGPRQENRPAANRRRGRYPATSLRGLYRLHIPHDDGFRKYADDINGVGRNTEKYVVQYSSVQGERGTEQLYTGRARLALAEQVVVFGNDIIFCRFAGNQGFR